MSRDLIYLQVRKCLVVCNKESLLPDLLTMTDLITKSLLFICIIHSFILTLLGMGQLLGLLMILKKKVLNNLLSLQSPNLKVINIKLRETFRLIANVLLWMRDGTIENEKLFRWFEFYK